MATTRKLTRASTGDRGPPSARELLQVHTVEQIGPKRKMLPNGFMLCEDVPIARVGWMLYAAGEVPLTPDPLGRIYVERTEEALFRPETMASFMASPVVDGHPDTDDGVTPENWRELAGGFSTTNVRRGTGPDSDVLLADLIISRKDLIEQVDAGKREVSAGYDADYEQTARGQGIQLNIIGNHIALVERGRCGPRCAIGDHLPPTLTKETTMTTTKAGVARRRIDAKTLDGLAEMVGKAQAALTADPEDEDQDGSIHVHVHTGDTASTGDKKGKDGGEGADPYEERFSKIEKTLDAVSTAVNTLGESLKSMATDGKRRTKDGEEEDPDAMTDDKKGKTKDSEGAPGTEGADGAQKQTKDSAALETSYKELNSKCEILVPGFRMPTFDAAQPRKLTVDRMCAQRRRCLDLLSATTDGAKFLGAIAGDPDVNVEAMDCSATAVLFNAAAAAKASANQRAATGDQLSVAEANKGKPKVMTIADMNAANAKFWAEQNGSK